jgi:hypothetical protein
VSIEDLAPPDFKWTTKDDPKRCWMCGYYSFKTYGGDDSTSGKCFRDHKSSGKVWYVDGLMTCPGFIPDETATYDPRSAIHED